LTELRVICGLGQLTKRGVSCLQRWK